MKVSTIDLLKEAQSEGFHTLEDNAGRKYSIDDVIDGIEEINDGYGLVRVGITQDDNEPHIHEYTDRGYIGQQRYKLLKGNDSQ